MQALSWFLRDELEKGFIQIREESTHKGVRMTVKFSLRQRRRQWCHKLNKIVDGGGGISQINSTRMIFCHKLGKFTFKRLIHLDKCHCLKLPFSIYTQLESPCNIFYWYILWLSESLSLGIFSILFTTMGYCLLKAEMIIRELSKSRNFISKVLSSSCNWQAIIFLFLLLLMPNVFVCQHYVDEKSKALKYSIIQGCGGWL